MGFANLASWQEHYTVASTLVTQCWCTTYIATQTSSKLASPIPSLLDCSTGVNTVGPIPSLLDCSTGVSTVGPIPSQSYPQGYVRDWPPSGCFSRLPGLFLHIYNLGSYPGHTAYCSFSSLQNFDSTKDYVEGGTFLIKLKYLWSSIYLRTG